MPKPLLPADLLTLNQTLLTGGTKALYAAVASRGYAYANWAAGITQQMGMPEIASADYLNGTALLGFAPSIFRILPPDQVDKLRFDLAQSYLRALHRILRSGDAACVDRDLSIDELVELHWEGLQRNGLSIENWNLHFPLMILDRLAGAAMLNAFWTFLRDSRRRPAPIGTTANLALLAFIHRQAASADVKCRQMAGAWLSRNPMSYSGAAIERRLRAALRSQRPAPPPELLAFLQLLDCGACIAQGHDKGLPCRIPASRSAAAIVMTISTIRATDRDEGIPGPVPDRASMQVYEALIRRITAQ